uniref:Uncharacterized protein n=1 Tax=Arundo donax TaxID=35708 RepID=A0A0A8Y2K1_ARUDO
MYHCAIQLWKFGSSVALSKQRMAERDHSQTPNCKEDRETITVSTLEESQTEES